jgi:hypothetical protein
VISILDSHNFATDAQFFTYWYCLPVPGEVVDLICPHSSNSGILNMQWQWPNTSLDDFNVVVEVREYFQMPNSRMIDSVLRSRQEVQFDDTVPIMMITVASGVSE